MACEIFMQEQLLMYDHLMTRGSETWTQPVPLNVCAFANATDKDAQISSGTIYGPSGQQISQPLLPSHPKHDSFRFR